MWSFYPCFISTDPWHFKWWKVNRTSVSHFCHLKAVLVLMQKKPHIIFLTLYFGRIEDSAWNAGRFPTQVSKSLKMHKNQKWCYGPLTMHKNLVFNSYLLFCLIMYLHSNMHCLIDIVSSKTFLCSKLNIQQYSSYQQKSRIGFDGETFISTCIWKDVEAQELKRSSTGSC